ncbi:ascorbic acid mannose pathway regulator [Thalictrum thalictroides]|uniref:Ascorbic acid mannose pathway regulator n=1 Tax=Thalictrum thalictroides TaxID=46969 RepID=A0A7J6X935_THATH|nr:ascorbic acid mannose pathway regulator [Thalictrum thalictroides]
MVTRRNWSQLPQELQELIIRKLSTFEDYLSFVGVCQSWRSNLVSRHHYTFFQKTLPWLMLPEPQVEDDGITYEEDDLVIDEDDHNETRSFFSLSRNKVYHFDLPQAVGCHCWGSPYGWLVTCSDGNMSILNPLSNVCVALPPLSSLRNYSSSHSVRKVVLAISPASNTSSATPLVNQFVALVMFSGDKKLAFARPGDRAWTTVNSSSALYEDTVHINDQFYAIDVEGVVCRFDISTTPNQVSLHFACLPGEIDMEEGCRFYLVEMLGELHMVARFFYLQGRYLEYYHLEHARPFEEHHHAQTSSFQVFKLDLCTKEWKEVHTLGDYAFFLGNNTSFSLRVSEYPGCQSDAIYFTDDYKWESTLHMEGQHGKEGMESIGLDMGVFDLKTKRVKPFYDSDDVPTFLAPPIWITPNLY